MRVGILVDGDAEAKALKYMVSQLVDEKLHIETPYFVRFHPESSCQKIVNETIKRVRMLFDIKRVNRVLLLLDREQRGECPVSIAKDIEREFKTKHSATVHVVVKNRKYENWLISDIEALESLPNKFVVTTGFVSQVSPDRADSVDDAERLLKKICVKNGTYRKGCDQEIIARKQNPFRVAKNSRSFRRFLRLLTVSQYKDQSRKPK